MQKARVAAALLPAFLVLVMALPPCIHSGRSGCGAASGINRTACGMQCCSISADHDPLPALLTTVSPVTNAMATVDVALTTPIVAGEYRPEPLPRTGSPPFHVLHDQLLI